MLLHYLVCRILKYSLLVMLYFLGGGGAKSVSRDEYNYSTIPHTTPSMTYYSTQGI